MNVHDLAPDLSVRTATASDAAQLGALFDAYRVFYEAPADLDRSTAFVAERLERAATRFFVAQLEDELLGFAHAIPTFSATALRPAWLLEDLYVAPAHRRRGVGAALLLRVERFARTCDGAKIALQTARDNATAQRLYLASGYRRDDRFLTFERELA